MARGMGRGSVRLVRGVWIGRWRDSQGVEHRRALSEDRALADRMMSAIIRERDLARSGLWAEDLQERTVSEVLARWIEDRVHHWCDGHRENVMAAVAWISQRIGATRMGSLHPDAALALRREMIDLDLALNTVNQKFGCLLAAMRWADTYRVIARNPLAAIEELKVTEADLRKVRRALEPQEVARIIAASRIEDAARMIPLTPMWRALLETGMRFGEAALAQWSAVDEAGLSIRLAAATTKTKRGRDVMISADLMAELIALRGIHKATGLSGHVFRTPKGATWKKPFSNALRILKRMLVAAGVATDTHEVDVHALRTTVATDLIRGGVPTTVVASVLGHADLRTLQRHYNKLRPQETRPFLEKMWESRNAPDSCLTRPIGSVGCPPSEENRGQERRQPLPAPSRVSDECRRTGTNQPPQGG